MKYLSDLEIEYVKKWDDLLRLKARGILYGLTKEQIEKARILKEEIETLEAEGSINNGYVAQRKSVALSRRRSGFQNSS